MVRLPELLLNITKSSWYILVADFKSDVTVPVDDSTETLTRWDSYENFGKAVEGKEIGKLN